MTNEQFRQSVILEIRAMMRRHIQQGEPKPYAVQVCNGGEPDNFSDWLKSNNDDIGGNWMPDRVQANLDRYDKHPFD
jgi:hypothetical protein